MVQGASRLQSTKPQAAFNLQYFTIFDDAKREICKGGKKVDASMQQRFSSTTLEHEHGRAVFGSSGALWVGNSSSPPR